MNKVQKFLQTMKHNWDWSISGSKKFERLKDDSVKVQCSNSKKIIPL